MSSAGPPTKPPLFAVLDAFVDSGFNLIDTADVNSRWAPGHQGGESETVIGRAPFEDELQALCLAQGLGVINFFGLARGFLTGKYRSQADLAKSVRGAGCQGYMNPRGFAILAALDQVAAEGAATPAQVALAWQMAQPGITAPIVSATSVVQWQELARAADLALSSEQLEHLTAASTHPPR